MKKFFGVVFCGVMLMGINNVSAQDWDKQIEEKWGRSLTPHVGQDYGMVPVPGYVKKGRVPYYGNTVTGKPHYGFDSRVPARRCYSRDGRMVRC